MTMNFTFTWRQLVLVCFLITSPSYARLSEGPGIDELITNADVVCAGRIAGYDIVTVTGARTSMWLAARFIVDHKMKGVSQPNVLMILMNKLEQPEKGNDILAQLAGEKNISRFIVFLKETDRKMSQFKLLDDMNGMILVGSTAPTIEEQVGIEKHIEVEMTQGLKHLDSAQQEQIRTMLDKWQLGKHVVTNKQEEINVGEKRPRKPWGLPFD